jgi:hypothetical protein
MATINILQCKIPGFHSGEYEDDSFLGYSGGLIQHGVISQKADIFNMCITKLHTDTNLCNETCSSVSWNIKLHIKVQWFSTWRPCVVTLLK